MSLMPGRGIRSASARILFAFRSLCSFRFLPFFLFLSVLSAPSATAQIFVSTGPSSGFRMYSPNGPDWWLNPLSGSLNLLVNGNGNAPVATFSGGGNVGVANSTPQARLHVSSGAVIVDGSGANMSVGGLAGFEDAGRLPGYGAIFEVGKGTIEVQGSGYVAINLDPYVTQSPAVPLEVHPVASVPVAVTNFVNFGSSAATTVALVAPDAGGGMAQLAFGRYPGGTFPSAVISGVVVNGTNEPGRLVFGTSAGGANPLERMRIDEAGNVGVGTASPGAALEVSTSAVGSGGVVARFTRTGGAGASIQVYSDSTHFAQISNVYASGGMALGPYGQTSALFIDTNGYVSMGGLIAAGAYDEISGPLHVGSQSAGQSMLQTGVSGGFGLASAPTYSFWAQPDLGMFTPASEVLAFSTSGGEKVRIASSGNVGIGTTNPIFLLHVQQSLANANVMRIYNTSLSGSGLDLVTTSSGTQQIMTARGNDGNTAALWVLANGNVGVGTTAPIFILHAYGRYTGGGAPQISLAAPDTADGSYAVLNFRAGAQNIARVYSTYDSSAGQGQGDLTFQTSNSATGLGDKMTILSNGNVGVSTTTPQQLLHVNSSGAGVVLRLQNTAGYCDHTPGSASESVSCTSDARLKTAIEDAPGVLKELEKLRIRRYKIKATGQEAVGVIAQEVRKTAPELVKESSDGTLMVQQIGSWELIKAIQEMEARNGALRAQIQEERAEIERLNAELDALKNAAQSRAAAERK